MTEIDTIALYGPGQLKPEDLVAGFVARESTLHYFLAELSHQTTPNASPRHHLIIGQRGMGKTTLLHRIAIAIGDDAALAACFVPLTFREEQYNVINLHVFWCNCIDALLDWLEQHEQAEAAKKLEAELIQVETRYEQNRKDEADGNSAKKLFQSACAQLQRRPVLLLDNLDLILEALKKHDWGLRDYLQQSGNALVISAAAAYPKSLSDKKSAFFDFFRITTLQRLELPEIRACLYQLARRRGEPGQRVTELLNRSPGRIAALTEMTGGNPRTLAILYLLLESQAGEDAFADLEKLLDRMTPLYKARAEEAPPQARAVLDAVALAWDPITATEAAKESGLEIQTVNSQLSRLEKDGFIEKVEVTGSGRHGYQMVERFFNIWYLMRHGSRRLRQRVQWLTAFLRGFYSGGDRESIARDVLRSGNHQGRADMMMALSDCVDDPIVRKALNHAAGRDLLRCSSIRESIANLVDLRDIDPEQADMAELERSILTIKRKGFNAPEFWDLLGGSLEMNSAEKRRIVNSLPAMADDKMTELFTTLKKEVSELCADLNITAEQLTPYRAAVRDGSIRHCYDLQGASAAALHENNFAIAAIACLLALKKGGDLDEVRSTRERFAEETSELWERVASDPLFSEAETAERAYARFRILYKKDEPISDVEPVIRKAININSKNPRFLNALGHLLQYYSERQEEAEAAYRKAIELDDTDARTWGNLGNLLQYDLERYEEAEVAYRKAIELDATDANTWGNLGFLLQYGIERCEEAEVAYRKAIELDTKDAHTWRNLGNLLQYGLERYEEAEATYRKAIELDATDARTWRNLGNLLQYLLERYEEAEAAYRKAIELDAKDAGTWGNLGNLLQYRFKRYEEAEAAYRKAIELDATDADTWENLGNTLEYGLERYEEAEAAYRKAIELDPNLAYPWINLANLLSDNLNRYREAEAAYRQAIELEPNDNNLWNSFGVLLQYHLCKFQEAEQAYLKALEQNPENDNPLPHGNLAFLYWLDLKRPDAAKHHADLAGKGLDECGKQLLEVARLLAEDSLGLAWSAFDSALTLGGDALWDGYGSCLKYILRYVHHHGYGAKFQSWMEAADYPARYAPLYWAFCALREGEAILLNVNPEVRRTAEKIYQGLAIGKQSESPPQKPQRRRQR